MDKELCLEYKELCYKPTLCLPDDVLHIIKEYAKPVTHPDWRHLHIMCDFKFLMGLKPYEMYNCKTTQGDDFYYFQIKNIDFKIINNSLSARYP